MHDRLNGKVGVLWQHLIVLLDPGAIVDTMHDAYGRIDLTASPYGLFMAGPSARARRADAEHDSGHGLG